MFYAGTQPPEDIKIHFAWKYDNSFNSNRGFGFMMWISMLTIPVIVYSIIWISMNQTAEEIKKQQFKQPVKSEKLD